MDNILEIFKNNKDAITAVGILLTFIISLVSLWFTVKNNKAVHYVNSVTKNRVEWIDKLRKNVAEFMALLVTQDITDTVLDFDDFIKIPIGGNIKQLNQIGSEIKLMLNFSDEFDKDIMDKIDLIILEYQRFHKIQRSIIDNKKNNNIFFVPNEEIMELEKSIEKLSSNFLGDMQVYLKSEWNRVKYESKGKKYEKETQLFDLEELKKKKANPKYKNHRWKRFYVNTKARVKRFFTLT